MYAPQGCFAARRPARRRFQSAATPPATTPPLAEAPAGLSYADALRELFGLDRAAPAAVTTPAVASVVEVPRG